MIIGSYLNFQEYKVLFTQDLNLNLKFEFKFKYFSFCFQKIMKNSPYAYLLKINLSTKIQGQNPYGFQNKYQTSRITSK
jgi:hypothetical protein